MASSTLVKSGIVLLQPEFVFHERVPNVSALAEYLQRAEEAARIALRESNQGVGSAGFIVLAIRPGLASKVWLDLAPPLHPDESVALISKIEAVTPIDVQVGPVVLAIKVRIRGEEESERNMPSPEAWHALARKAGRALEIGELVELAWVDD